MFTNGHVYSYMLLLLMLILQSDIRPISLLRFSLGIGKHKLTLLCCSLGALSHKLDNMNKLHTVCSNQVQL